MIANALIVNSAGLGDGLIEIPFLKNMADVAPRVRFYHTGSTVFSDKTFTNAANLTTLLGTVPSAWRTFEDKEWPAIRAFVVANNIDLIINLRNFGPAHDGGYFAFKQTSPPGVAFWNYRFDGRHGECGNIRTQMRELLSSRGVINASLNSLSLRDAVRAEYMSRKPSGIAINIHAGNVFKLWPDWKWRILCQELVEKEHLKVFAGHGDIENRRAADLVRQVDAHRPGAAKLIQCPDILTAVGEVASSRCVVTVDSWMLHAAAGLGVRAVGLYIVTSPLTWGGDTDHCVSIESNHLRRCERFDPLIGLCRNHYRECPLIEREGDGIDVKDVLDLLSGCTTLS